MVVALSKLANFSRIIPINENLRTFATSNIKFKQLKVNGKVIGKTWSSGIGRTTRLKRKYRILSTTNGIRALLIQDTTTNLKGSQAAVRIDVGQSDCIGPTGQLANNISNLLKKCIHTVVNQVTRNYDDPVGSYVFGDVTFDSTVFSFAEKLHAENVRTSDENLVWKFLRNLAELALSQENTLEHFDSVAKATNFRSCMKPNVLSLYAEANIQKHDRIMKMRETLLDTGIDPNMPTILFDTPWHKLPWDKELHDEPCLRVLSLYRTKYFFRTVSVCIHSHLELDEMEKNFVDNFLINSVDAYPREPPPTKKRVFHKPHSDRIVVPSNSEEQQLVMQFPHIQKPSLAQSNSLQIIADFLSYGGTGSMTDLLIRQKTGTSCKFSHDNNLGLLVTVDLKPPNFAMENISTITQQLFNYLKFHVDNDTGINHFKEFTVKRMLDNFADIYRSEKGTVAVVQNLEFNDKFDELDLYATTDERHMLNDLLNSFENCIYWVFAELTHDVKHTLGLSDEIRPEDNGRTTFYYSQFPKIKPTEMSDLFIIPELSFFGYPIIDLGQLIREPPISLRSLQPTPDDTDDYDVEHLTIGCNDVTDVPYLIIWKYILKLEFRNVFSEFELMKLEAYITKRSDGLIISSQYRMPRQLRIRIEEKLDVLKMADPVSFSDLKSKFEIAQDVATKKMSKKLVNSEALARSLLHTCIHNLLGTKVMPPLPMRYVQIVNMTFDKLREHPLNEATPHIHEYAPAITARDNTEIYISSMDRLEDTSYGLCCYFCGTDLSQADQMALTDIFEAFVGNLVRTGVLPTFDVVRYRFQNVFAFVVTVTGCWKENDLRHKINEIDEALMSAKFGGDGYSVLQGNMVERRFVIGITRHEPSAYAEQPKDVRSMSFDEWFNVWMMENIKELEKIMDIASDGESDGESDGP
ncbi:uncharacterized protein LOC119082594 [Bradysia coprophila]|uniref:uncharacterized protein LOC119082594 n=1 Tax=Bradysia coprophila TaxID=38358 RepID=UPI00187DC028|nr:uncharacterized protein LOC119082594 [Bradysia coprophila]